MDDRSQGHNRLGNKKTGGVKRTAGDIARCGIRRLPTGCSFITFPASVLSSRAPKSFASRFTMTDARPARDVRAHRQLFQRARVDKRREAACIQRDDGPIVDSPERANGDPDIVEDTGAPSPSVTREVPYLIASPVRTPGKDTARSASHTPQAARPWSRRGSDTYPSAIAILTRGRRSTRP